jgi:hypothetical protein
VRVVKAADEREREKLKVNSSKNKPESYHFLRTSPEQGIKAICNEIKKAKFMNDGEVQYQSVDYLWRFSTVVFHPPRMT